MRGKNGKEVEVKLSLNDWIHHPRSTLSLHLLICELINVLIFLSVKPSSIIWCIKILHSLQNSWWALITHLRKFRMFGMSSKHLKLSQSGSTVTLYTQDCFPLSLPFREYLEIWSYTHFYFFVSFVLSPEWKMLDIPLSPLQINLKIWLILPSSVSILSLMPNLIWPLGLEINN